MCPVGTTARSISIRKYFYFGAEYATGWGQQTLTKYRTARPPKSCKMPYRGDKEKIMFSQGWAPGFLKLQGVKNKNKIK